MITLQLAFPPSTNSIWRAVVRKRKGGGAIAVNILSESYRLWRDLAASDLALQMRGQEPIKGPYRMVMVLERKDRRATDLSNRIKAAEDSLVTAGVVEDDSLCESLEVRWSSRPPGKGAVAHITIEPVNASI